MEQGFSGQPPISSQLSETSQRILDAVVDVELHDEFICKNGVKLKLNKVPSQLVMAATNNVPVPKIPTFRDEEAGRDRENLDDPAYQQALTDASVQKGLLATSIYFGMGTKLIKPLPEGIPDPNDSEWAEDIEELTGLKVKPTGRSRYVAWLTYLIVGDDEIGPLMEKIQRLSGSVPEADASAAVDSFPSDNEAQRNPVIRIHPSAEDESGSNV